jgi:hypothetical protein
MRKGRVLPTQRAIITEKRLHILKDGASGVQVGDDEQVTIKNLFEI